MQLGVPILFFGEGEGELIVREEKIGFTCNSNDFTGLRNNILKFIKLNQKEYSGMTNRLLELHRDEYNLEKQLQKLFGNNFLK